MSKDKKSSLSLLNNRFFDSRIKSKNTIGKERWLGFLLGPCGALLLNAVLGTYLNQYYVDVLGMGTLFGGLFLALFPIFSKILDAVVDIFYGYLIERTKSKQGKARPWLLVSAPLLTLSGILLFTVPQANEVVQAIYVVFSYNFFYSVAYSIYNMSYNLQVPLSTRNAQQRGLLSVFNQVSVIAISGILVALIFPMVVLPLIGVDKTKWLLVMIILSVIALPLTLIQYYFTKERVTEEKKDDNSTKVPFLLQLKAIFTDKYFLLLIVYYIVYNFGTQFKNLGLVYYSNYVLGTYSDGITQTLISVLGGVPMGIGIFCVWPLVKRFGKRTVTYIGFIIYAIGSLICCIDPTNMVVVLIGQFIKNTGSLPSAYVFMALMADVIDSIEWKTGFRVDGVSTATYNIVQTTTVGVVTGLFNLCLTGTGYKAPVTNTIAIQGVGEQIAPIDNGNGTFSHIFEQGDETRTFLIMAFVGLEVITGLICALIVFFLDVEKNIPQKQAIITQREKEKFEKEGKIWLPINERIELENEESEKEAEENYIKETKAMCEKTGKDFAKVYALHCYKKEQALKKAKEKDEQATLKEKAYQEKLAKKREAKLAKMNETQKEKYLAHEAKVNKKHEAKWAKEKEKGQRIYEAYQKELAYSTNKKG